MNTHYFLNMIRQLRENEEVMLYNHILKVGEAEAQETILYLQKAYAQETLHYPAPQPAFDGEAALWAAKVIYFSSQLMLYRENKAPELEQIIPVYSGEINASSILSADLCLRFMPPVLIHLKMIDHEDILIPVLESILYKWHYSGVSYMLEGEKLDFTAYSNHEGLLQLYTNRIIHYKKINLAKLPLFQSRVQGALGLYGDVFWKAFKLDAVSYESNG